MLDLFPLKRDKFSRVGSDADRLIRKFAVRQTLVEFFGEEGHGR